jgi:hypothetical protein
MRSISSAAVLIAAAALSFAATTADAGVRDRSRSFQGPNGRGYVANRHVDRGPGHAVVARGLQTSEGRGVDASRTTTWGDARISRQRQVQTDDGRSATGWSTIYRTDDGVTVDRQVTTGSGETWSRSRSYDRDR